MPKEHKKLSSDSLTKVKRKSRKTRSQLERELLEKTNAAIASTTGESSRSRTRSELIRELFPDARTTTGLPSSSLSVPDESSVPVHNVDSDNSSVVVLSDKDDKDDGVDKNEPVVVRDIVIPLVAVTTTTMTATMVTTSTVKPRQVRVDDIIPQVQNIHYKNESVVVRDIVIPLVAVTTTMTSATMATTSIVKLQQVLVDDIIPQVQNIHLIEDEPDDEQIFELTPVVEVEQQRQPVRRPAPRRRHANVPHKVTYNDAYRLNNAVENMSKHDVGLLNQECQFCGALHYEKEKADRQGRRRLCCNNGEIVLPRLKACPPVLRAYLTNDNAEARLFRNNIRSINSLFAMASFKTSVPQERQFGQGHWSFSICGQIYHYTEAIPLTPERREPIMNQYYFVDADQAIDRRANLLADRLVPREMIERIEVMLREVNPFVRSYQTMREVIDEMREQGQEVDDMVLAFSNNMRRDLRIYDLPESRSDVAAVFYGEDPPFNVDLKIYPKTRNADRELKNLNRMSDPMVYPILFPKGDYGYDTALKYRTRPNKTITIREFYRHRIQVRVNQFSILHHADKLFQQYLVDAWCRAEANILWWYRNNQQQLRVAGKQAIDRMLEARAATDNLRVGNVVMLPSNFLGGPRFQSRKYLDAMTVVSRLGKPDLFITMTCNPNWPEITDNLEHRQQWQHRPDLVARVFNCKLNELMDDINNKQIYGVVSYSMYVIEFQKRGLPHAHILVTLRPEDKLDTEEKIDTLICAYFPDPVVEPNLFAMIAANYVHRPCGRLNLNAPCMREGKCSKGYPKKFQENTVLLEEHLGQPAYKRPADGRGVEVNNIRVDNRRVIPYNRYATMKYRCHINFEVCGSLKSIKYLHKYVYKGPDCITVQVKENDGTVNWDEIRHFLDCRYVSAMEACWRLFEFKLGDRTHAVMALPVHLPDDHPVYFDDFDDVDQIREAVDKPTKLTAYFNLNSNHADARQYRYYEIPEHYTWENKEHYWRPRVQTAKMFGCMVEVSPQELEKWCLRLLLSHVSGATSFEDLRTVDGVVRDTFEAACRARNLLHNIDEYDRCLQQALWYRTPKGFRRLFALICCVAAAHVLGQIPVLWERHRADLIEDFLERCNGDDMVAESRALMEIADVLERNGNFTLEQFGLPSIDRELVDFHELHAVHHDEDVFADFAGDEGSLNEEQNEIYQLIMTTIANQIDNNEYVGDDNRGLMFYVDAPGGTGKTFLFNTILKNLRTRRLDTVAVAWTGIAASLLLAGKTVHRAFKLPLNITETTPRCGFPIESNRANYIKNSKLIVWDEAPMSPKHAVRLVDNYLRDLMQKPHVPMGGKICLFGGDFRQVLPVVPHGHRTQVIATSLKASPLWPLMRKCRLHQNVRAGPDEREFSEWLIRLGDGKLPRVKINKDDDETLPKDLIEIPKQCLTKTYEQLCTNVFGARFQDVSVGDRAVLCPTNVSVNEINRHVLDNLPGEVKTYVSVDEYDNVEGDELYVNQDFLHSIAIASLPPHELDLKVGAVCMFLRNLDVDMGQCNGARCKIVDMKEHVLLVEMLSGTHKGEQVLLPKIEISARDPALPKDIKRFQFPIRLAFAMTINKSQGQTFAKIGIYLKNPCFSHGQLYVAFSRTGSFRNVSICVENTTKQGSFKFRTGRCFTRNIVYETIVENLEPVAIDQINEEDLINRAREGEDEVVLDFQDIDFDDVFQLSMHEDVEDYPCSEEDEVLKRILIPDFSDEQLKKRVSTGNRAGTTGMHLSSPIAKRPRVTYSDDSD